MSDMSLKEKYSRINWMQPYTVSARDLRSITFVLILLNALAWGLDTLSGHLTGQMPLTENGMLYWPAVFGGEFYRIFTYMFLHSGFMHLLCNMAALFAVGFQMEEFLGRGRYLLLYFGSGLTSALAVLAADMLGGYPVYTLGASGAIFGLMGARIAMELRFRRDTLRSAQVRRLLIAALVLLIPGATGMNVSVSGHLGGFFGGFLIGLLYTL